MATPTSTPFPDPTNTFFASSHLIQHGRPIQPAADFPPSPTSFYSLAHDLESFSMPESIDHGLSSPSQEPFPSLHIAFPAPLLSESMIAAATTPQEILLLLRESGFRHTADRLRYLQDLARDDPDEPSMVIDSMKALVAFLAAERSLSDPEIGISPNGLAQIEWRIPQNGILAMEFLPTSLIRFAAVSASTHPADTRLRVNGTLPRSEVLDAIRSFTSSIARAR